MPMIIGAVCLLVALYLFLSAKAPDAIYKTFKLQPGQWKLVSSDLGDGHPRKQLRGEGAGGEPDAIFRHAQTGQLAVGEFKNRNYKGYVRRREYYQVVLYIGLARMNLRSINVIGVLAFKDATIQIEHDETTFRALLSLRQEIIQSLRNRTPASDVPLHKRIKLKPRNAAIRFPG